MLFADTIKQIQNEGRMGPDIKPSWAALFLLGMLTRRVGENAAIAGMMAGFASMLYVKLGTHIAWTWYVLIGTSVTFTVGMASSLVTKRKGS